MPLQSAQRLQCAFDAGYVTDADQHSRTVSEYQLKTFVAPNGIRNIAFFAPNNTAAKPGPLLLESPAAIFTNRIEFAHIGLIDFMPGEKNEVA